MNLDLDVSCTTFIRTPVVSRHADIDAPGTALAGARDPVVLDRVAHNDALRVHAAQYVRQDFTRQRIWLVRVQSGPLRTVRAP